MRRLFLIAFCFSASPAFAADAPKAKPPVATAVESTLATLGSRIRQFAFDGDTTTFFASERNATKTDTFTLTFDTPVAIESIAVDAARPNGEDALTAGALEVSTDGKTFDAMAKFETGKALAKGNWKGVLAVRIRATDDLKHPLVIREIAVGSEPKIAAFKYPIEIALDVADAPEMKEWGEKVIRICEKEYPRICDLLKSEGFKPTTQIRMAFKSDYNGVAEASGNRIRGSVKYFKANPKDIGAMVHETAHCVQLYRGRNNPGWLVEGVADYVRFWQYEPGKAGKLSVDKAQYNGSYRTTAAFLAFVTDKYEPKLVTKLNATMREGKYDVTIWKTLTGKSVEELNQEWRESLAK